MTRLHGGADELESLEVVSLARLCCVAFVVATSSIVMMLGGKGHGCCMIV
jgi:hypothetical protein